MSYFPAYSDIKIKKIQTFQQSIIRHIKILNDKYTLLNNLRKLT